MMTHQVEGVQFLLQRKGALLAFEQGLGKTLVAIEAFRELRRVGTVDTLVVLCPNSLKRTWEAELQKFAPELKTLVVGGPSKERRPALARGEADVFLINYELARNEIVAIQALMRRRLSALVLDESHYAKNIRSLNSIAAQHLAPFTDYRWLLTGTPITNSPADVYAQLRVVTAGRTLSSHAAFTATFGNAQADAKQRDALTDKIGPYLLRRRKEDCLDLPDKTVVDVMVELPPWQRTLYSALRDEVSKEVKGMTPEAFRRFMPSAMARLLRLSQVASNPGLAFPDENREPGKFSALDRLLNDLVAVNQRKVIVWSYFVRSIEALTLRYAHYGAASLYGGTPETERQQVAARFQGDDTLKVLVANPAAAGVGLTLTAASYAIYETLSWRYDLYAQSQDRNHRIGQRNPVTYIRLLAADTIEQAISQALARKARMAGDLLGDAPGEFSIDSMNPEGFLRLLETGRLSLPE